MFKSKAATSCCSLLLCLLLCLSFGSVKATAASNLINPKLNEWENITTSLPNDPSVEGSLKMSVHTIKSSVGNIYRLQPTSIGVIGDSPPSKFFYGHMFDKTVLKAGNSYTFQMHILSPSEIRRYTSYTWDDSTFTARLGHGYIIGFGVVDFNGEVTYIQEFVAITPDNYSSLAGNDFVLSFECPSYSGGNPCIFIMSSWVDAESTFFFDDSMVLIDNAEEDEEGFLAGLFEWFDKKLNGLGSSIVDALSVIPESLLNGIKSLFVPSDDFFDLFKTQMDKILEDNLGFVYQGSRTLFQLFQGVYDMLDAPDALPGSSNFIFPAIDFKLNFGKGDKAQSYDIDLSDSSSVDLSFLNDTGSFWYTFYHVYYKAILYIILAGAVLIYGYNTFEKLFR